MDGDAGNDSAAVRGTADEWRAHVEIVNDGIRSEADDGDDETQGKRDSML